MYKNKLKGIRNKHLFECEDETGLDRLTKEEKEQAAKIFGDLRAMLEVNNKNLGKVIIVGTAGEIK